MFLNNKKITKITFVLLFFVLFFPVLSHAALVNCDGVTVKCDFGAFISLINGIINWIISIAGIIFTISCIWGGFLYLTSGENPGNKEKAKSILWSTLIGFVIILTAWLIVHTILVTLVPAGSGTNSIFNFIGGR